MAKELFPREFVEWMIQYAKYCTNGNSPHYKQFYVDTDGKMGVRYLWLWIDDLYEYWLYNVKNKKFEKTCSSQNFVFR